MSQARSASGWQNIKVTTSLLAFLLCGTKQMHHCMRNLLFSGPFSTCMVQYNGLHVQIANIYIDLKTDGQNNMMQSHDARTRCDIWPMITLGHRMPVSIIYDSVCDPTSSFVSKYVTDLNISMMSWHQIWISVMWSESICDHFPNWGMYLQPPLSTRSVPLHLLIVQCSSAVQSSAVQCTALQYNGIHLLCSSVQLCVVHYTPSPR